MRPPLQVETKHDGAGRQPFWQMRNQGIAALRAKQAWHDDEKCKHRHCQNGYDFPGRKPQHDGAILHGWGAAAAVSARVTLSSDAVLVLVLILDRLALGTHIRNH